ncbi:conserved hypothetical protein [Clostridium neonatale]|uniref:hypothetical protein n=1 Tax=Clostridium neonatale TaxID=137838 RepID=UPI00291BA96A|nr:hypothetical protein [Clostridium neonatale]CAI3605547.1 conserved hypothetical protein [Clostridium neonatale]
MITSTPEQQQKYITAINNVLAKYDNMIKNINSEALKYAREFYDFTRGKITVKFINEAREKAKDNMTRVSVEAYTDMVYRLQEIKEQYFNECFPTTETIDALELDFIGKELEVMSCEELEEFYKTNFLDKNKVRLFDIELKRRKRLVDKGGNEVNSDIVKLELVREQFCIEDKVTNLINLRIKQINAYKSVSANMFVLIKNIDINNELQPIMQSYSNLIAFIEGRSRNVMPSNINVMDMLNYEIEV